MLIEFRVENHCSLRDEQVLTMEAGRVGDGADPRPRQVSGYAGSLLPVAVLYGANASGKSNVLAVLAFMRDAVVSSHRSWAPDEGVPRDPFAWGPGREEPSLFEVSFLLDDVRYQYGFVASDERFLEEWLHAWPNGKKQVWFEREGDAFKFGEHLKGENKLIEEITRSNALFLSAAAQHRHPQLTRVFSWFRSIEIENLWTRRHLLDVPAELHPPRWFGGDEDARVRKPLASDSPARHLLDAYRTLLRYADVGIVDIRFVESGSKDSRQGARVVGVEFKHHDEFDGAWLPLEKQSRGTQALFRLALPILYVLDEGGILLVDELEASLHPALAQEIVRQFNDPAANPRNAQLICTTHDTNLLGTTLGEPPLRRDQVWLTEKDDEGATVLYPLTDYKPRKAENIERGYLQGRYGAIPFLGDFHLGGELSATAKG